MSSDKKSHKKLILSALIASTIPTPYATANWDCQQTDSGWNCSAAEISDSPAAGTVQNTEAAASEPKRVEAPASLQNTRTELNTQSPAKNSKPTQQSESVSATNSGATAPALASAETLQPDTETAPYSPQSNIAVTTESEKASSTQAQSAEPEKSVSARIDLSDRRADIQDRSQNLDWMQLPPLETIGKVCTGAYVEPNIWTGTLAPSNETSSTFIDADQSSSVLGGVTTLQGDVVMQQSGRQIQSEFAELDSNNRQALLRSNVRLRQPGFLLTADTLSADLNTDITIANEARYVLHESELRGEALVLTRYADTSIETQDSLVTYCEPGSDDWAIRAREMKLYPAQGYGESWHTRFEIAGVPVFYLPYFYFPLDDTRRSGFLYPSLSTSEEDGYDLAIPYYFNIAPNLDDTLTTRVIEQRGMLLENELRYLDSFGMNQLSTGWMPSDNKTSNERWLLNFDHQGSPAPGWSSAIDFSRVSDDAYFDDLAPVELRAPQSDDLNQRASISYGVSNWSASALVNDYQTIDGGTEPYARMPQLTLNGSNRLGDTGRLDSTSGLNDLRVNYAAQYTEFQHDSLVDGQRMHLRPSLDYDWNRTWGFLRPEVGLWNSSYELSDNSSSSATANFASLDSGLIFEREGELVTQTLEPRIKLIKVAGDDTQNLRNFDSGALGFSAGNLFDTLGYSGNDRVAQTEQATIGLTSRFYSLSGRELLSIGIAQAQYFTDHDPRPGDSSGIADQSDYAINANWKPSDVLTLSHDSRVDEKTSAILSQNYGMLYNPEPSKLLYTSFRQTQTDTSVVQREQIDIAGKWPLSPSWSLVGRWTEDLNNNENLETLLGVEYGSCCWKVRFTGQRQVIDGSTDYERENAFYLQFVLKGFGSLGQSEGRQFLKDLTGFDEDNNENF